ncbi:hypothetical protein [Taibaiella koreensis]|uniref:hypothetical protein n=1 Tax=Taibaiella koreensis TaxID=1268548 RepID=UPI000E59EB45|nr:hypothetical protein [Taibaiella koreensis]
MRTVTTFSKYTFLLCAVLIAYSGSFFYPRWKKGGGEAQLSWDAGGYYWYLPSVFIYHDLRGQHFKDSILNKYQPTPPDDFQYGFWQPSGNYVIRYTMGTAILEAPWFFIAHALARPLGYPADGFSLPYQFMIYLGGMLFTLLGLWYLRKLLLLYFNDTVTGITLFLLVAGTNYLNYGGIEVGMTHSWLFTLYVFLFLNTHYYYERLQRKYLLRVAALIGLIALVRPPEIIAVLIPVFWGMNSLWPRVLRERLRFFKKQLPQIVLGAGIVLAILSIQFFYWKYASGQWFVYTYQQQGFSWRRPHFKMYALNYQCGWLLYTPVMLFALAGIIPLIWSGRNKIAILLLIGINYYIVAAWDAWDYGGRAMIQNYPALLFPLASLVHFLLRKKIGLILATPLLLPAVYFNIWWTYQAHKGTLIGGAPGTRAYYLATIFRYNLPPEVQMLRDNEDAYTGAVHQPIVLYSGDTASNSRFTVTQDEQHSISFPVKEKHKWIRASADIHIDQKEWGLWFMTHYAVRLKKGNDVVQENSIRLQRLLDKGDTKNMTVDVKVKYDVYDNIELLFYNENKGTIPCYVDHIKVIGFDH